jgi:hypothetical protein
MRLKFEPHGCPDYVLIQNHQSGLKAALCAVLTALAEQPQAKRLLVAYEYLNVSMAGLSGADFSGSAAACKKSSSPDPLRLAQALSVFSND